MIEPLFVDGHGKLAGYPRRSPIGDVDLSAPTIALQRDYALKLDELVGPATRVAPAGAAVTPLWGAP